MTSEGNEIRQTNEIRTNRNKFVGTGGSQWKSKTDLQLINDIAVFPVASQTNCNLAAKLIIWPVP